jgi:Domain of unknown function (DUF4276)
LIVPSPENPEWRFVRFGLLVTGRGEELFLPRLFRALTGSGECTFEIIARIGHLSPITSEKRKVKMTGSGKQISTKDEDIGIAARLFLQKHKGSHVLLIDDLEGDRVSHVKAVYDRYRLLLDTMLRPLGLQDRVSVHFLVNMLEAYYFAHAKAINEVMGTDWGDYEGDVETITHPKKLLKAKIAGFHEIKHGEGIVRRLDLRHILSRPETCASLRTIVAWCVRALGRPFGPDFRLADGQLFPVTRDQVRT